MLDRLSGRDEAQLPVDHGEVEEVILVDFLSEPLREFGVALALE